MKLLIRLVIVSAFIVGTFAIVASAVSTFTIGSPRALPETAIVPDTTVTTPLTPESMNAAIAEYTAKTIEDDDVIIYNSPKKIMPHSAEDLVAVISVLGTKATITIGCPGELGLYSEDVCATEDYFNSWARKVNELLRDESGRPGGKTLQAVHIVVHDYEFQNMSFYDGWEGTVVASVKGKDEGDISDLLTKAFEYIKLPKVSITTWSPMEYRMLTRAYLHDEYIFDYSLGSFGLSTETNTYQSVERISILLKGMNGFLDNSDEYTKAECENGETVVDAKKFLSFGALKRIAKQYIGLDHKDDQAFTEWNQINHLVYNACTARNGPITDYPLSKGSSESLKRMYDFSLSLLRVVFKKIAKSKKKTKLYYSMRHVEDVDLFNSLRILLEEDSIELAYWNGY